MELCTSRGIISNLPLLQPSSHIAHKHIQSSHCKSNSPFLFKQIQLNTGSRRSINSSLRSLKSEDTSTETTLYIKDERPESESEPELERDSSLELFKFLEDFDIKLQFDYEDTYSVLVLGGGGVVALWLAASVVSALDSIPLVPKLLELVGLGYTVWFTSRYLIFKENRDELVARVEQIKQQVLGPKDD